MKKLIASSVLATATLFPALVQAEEILPSKMSVEQKVDVRKGATASYPLVTSLSKGQSVTIIDLFTNSSGELWYRVDLGTNKGWALSTSFSKETAETINTGNIAVINADNVNIRKGATISYEVVTKLSKNQKVKILDSFTNSRKELWYRVEIATFKGWVISDFVSLQEEVKPPPPTTNQSNIQTVQVNRAEVRKGATNTYSVVASLSLNQKVNIIDTFTNAKGEEWYRVDLGSIKGWVLANAFEVAPKPPAPEKPENPNLPSIDSYVYSQQSGVMVRKGATDSYQAVTSLALNQKVKVIDHFTHKTGEAWVRVSVNSSIAGWVPANSVATSQSQNLTLYVSVDVANLRSGPSINDSIVDKATLGTSFVATNSETDSKGDLWYMVTTKDNKIVWVHETVVSQEKVNLGSTMYIGTKNAVLYSGASFQYKVTEKLSYYSKVSVLSEFTNSANQSWVQIKSATGRTGWIPKYELVASKNDYQYVYALKNAVIRKGANTQYAASAYPKENDSLIVLTTHNTWINVETQSGVRGWIDTSLTSPVSMKKLVSPMVESVNGEQYVTWQKPSDFKFNYTTLGSNRLKLTGGLTDIELPTEQIEGVQSIDVLGTETDRSLLLTLLPGYTFTIRNYEDRVSIKIVEAGLAGKRIVIDAGHGGKDPGAIGPTGLREKDVVLDTALMLKAELEKYGAIVTMTRSTDVFLELSERTAIANASDFDAFISLHADSYSSSSKGTTTYYNTTVNFNGPRSRDLGSAIQKGMIASLGTYDRGIKEQEFYVNRMNELPSVLLELAFLSNPKEEALLRSTEFRKNAASGIRAGLEEYFTNF
ncbi:SH3 domain-containing protein [Cytobacillus sp. FJAT-54145]|uniref:SH3 domain-containing protein n=1 Tax=Cytobacillus spartinae TaxID=3299023 RepID=A0ABW6KEL8_9BACI